MEKNICKCGHSHIMGDDGEDGGCSVCDCSKWEKMEEKNICSDRRAQGLDDSGF